MFPTKLFKIFNKALSRPLTNLINISFVKAVLPSVLKTAQVLPAFKKGDNTDEKIYRPISLISNASKILENLMHKRIYSFLEKNTTFYPYQFGFNTDHLTDSAFIETAEQIWKAHGKGLFACRVYLDLKKTFHTVNHNIPLTKPEYYSTLKPIIGFLHS